MSTVLLEKQRRVEYGDFQTPTDLAQAVCRALRGREACNADRPDRRHRGISGRGA
jgi:hypothetical protein